MDLPPSIFRNADLFIGVGGGGEGGLSNLALGGGRVGLSNLRLTSIIVCNRSVGCFTTSGLCSCT